MNNKEKLFLLKASGQINPMSPALSKGFDINGTNYSLAKPQTPELGSPSQMLAGINQAPQPQAPQPQAPQPGGFNNIGANGKPMTFEPSDGSLAVTPEIMEMGRTGTYPQQPSGASAAGAAGAAGAILPKPNVCLLYTSPSPRDLSTSRMPSSA